MEPSTAPTCDSAGITLDDCGALTELRRGRHSIVYTTYCVPLDTTVAVKVYERPVDKPKKQKMAAREATMLRYLGSQGVPNVTQLWGAYHTPERTVLVMEYCSGGNLLDALRQRGSGWSEEHVASAVAAPLVRTLARLHHCGVVHRDVKLENIFLDAAGRPKLGDYDLSVMASEAPARGPVGTIFYMAPEVLRLAGSSCRGGGAEAAASARGVGEKMDVWSLGVCIFELVAGYKPFQGATHEAIAAAVLQRQRASLPPGLSPDFVDFIDACLCHSPCSRPSAAELASHPWLRSHSCAWPAGSIRSDSAGSLEEVKLGGSCGRGRWRRLSHDAVPTAVPTATHACWAAAVAAVAAPDLTHAATGSCSPAECSSPLAAAVAAACGSCPSPTSLLGFMALPSSLASTFTGTTVGLSRTLTSMSSLLLPHLVTAQSLPSKASVSCSPPLGSFMAGLPPSTPTAQALPPPPLPCAGCGAPSACACASSNQQQLQQPQQQGGEPSPSPFQRRAPQLAVHRQLLLAGACGQETPQGCAAGAAPAPEPPLASCCGGSGCGGGGVGSAHSPACLQGGAELPGVGGERQRCRPAGGEEGMGGSSRLAALGATLPPGAAAVSLAEQWQRALRGWLACLVPALGL